MACAEDTAGDVEWLRHRLRVKLGDDRWRENNDFRTGRDPFWYITLINLTDPLVDTRDGSKPIGTEASGEKAFHRWISVVGSSMDPE